MRTPAEAPSTSPIVKFRIGDRLELKKEHACGANRWEVVRIGADIRLRCEGCQHRIMMARPELERRVTGFIIAGLDEPASSPDTPRADG